MKRLLLIMAVLTFGVLGNPVLAQKKTEVACFKSNMDCSSCQKTITEYLKFEKGVKDLKVDHVTNTIKVEYKSGKNDAKGFAKAIEKKGYEAKEISFEEYEKITAPHKGHDHSKDDKH